MLRPLAALAALLLAGCTRLDPPRREPAVAVPDVIAPFAGPREAPALEAPPIERLEIGLGEVAYVALPSGARDRRAILVGVHGAGDRPDWACSEWKAVTADWAIVVCPQAPARHPQDREAFVWGSAASIADQTDRAVAAVRARYRAWVADGPLVYGGWSQGGTLAAEVIASRPGVYDRVALVEIGHTPLDAAAVAHGLAAGGVRRAVVSCESAKCADFARRFQRAAGARIATRVVDVGRRPHWFDEPVFRTLGPMMVWMVDDQPRFAGLGAAVDARWMTD